MAQWKRGFVLLAGLLSLCLLLVGCGSASSTPPPKTQIFVGQVATSDAFIALVVDASGQTLAYVCDNTTVADWFQGAASQHTLDLTSAGGARVQGTLATEQITGTVTFGGQAHAFTAPPATGQTGLYRAIATFQGLDYVGGWDVLPDGQVRQGTKMVASSAFHPGGSVTLANGSTLSPQFVNNEISL